VESIKKEYVSAVAFPERKRIIHRGTKKIVQLFGGVSSLAKNHLQQI